MGQISPVLARDQPQPVSQLPTALQRRLRGRQVPLCGEEANTPRHILIPCSLGLMDVRLRLPAIVDTLPTPEELRRNGVVATLTAAFRALQSRYATSLRLPLTEGTFNNSKNNRLVPRPMEPQR